MRLRGIEVAVGWGGFGIGTYPTLNDTSLVIDGLGILQYPTSSSLRHMALDSYYSDTPLILAVVLSSKGGRAFSKVQGPDQDPGKPQASPSLFVLLISPCAGALFAAASDEASSGPCAKTTYPFSVSGGGIYYLLEGDGQANDSIR